MSALPSRSLPSNEVASIGGDSPNADVVKQAAASAEDTLHSSSAKPLVDKNLQRQQARLEKMKQLGQQWSLVYVGFYTGHFEWVADAAPSNQYTRAYWSCAGSSGRFWSASSITLQQKDKKGIEELTTVQALQRLCATICKGFTYLGPGMSQERFSDERFSTHLSNVKRWGL